MALGDATLARLRSRDASGGGGWRFPGRRVRGARARLRWTRVPSAPEDLELTLEAYARAGDARGAVAHWNANRRALSAESEAAEGEASMVWEVGSDGVLVSGCEPTPRAWTAVIKAHCDAGEVTQAAALLQEVESEARRGAESSGARGGAGLRAARRRRAGEKPSERNRRGGVETRRVQPRRRRVSRAGCPVAEDLLWLMDAAGVSPGRGNLQHRHRRTPPSRDPGKSARRRRRERERRHTVPRGSARVRRRAGHVHRVDEDVGRNFEPPTGIVNFFPARSRWR